MSNQISFKWRHFPIDLILLMVRWYLSYSLSYRNIEEMMLERGIHVDHTTINRWVIYYADLPPILRTLSYEHLTIYSNIHGA